METPLKLENRIWHECVNGEASTRVRCQSTVTFDLDLKVTCERERERERAKLKQQMLLTNPQNDFQRAHDLWPVELKIEPVQLCIRVHTRAKFGWIPFSGSQVIVAKIFQLKVTWPSTFDLLNPKFNQFIFGSQFILLPSLVGIPSVIHKLLR